MRSTKDHHSGMVTLCWISTVVPVVVWIMLHHLQMSAGVLHSQCWLGIGRDKCRSRDRQRHMARSTASVGLGPV